MLYAEVVDAVFVLAMRRSDKNMQPLLAAENDAKNKLAAAILAMDRADGFAVLEQLDVEVAKDEYAQALANLLRGDQ